MLLFYLFAAVLVIVLILAMVYLFVNRHHVSNGMEAFRSSQRGMPYVHPGEISYVPTPDISNKPPLDAYSKNYYEPPSRQYYEPPSRQNFRNPMESFNRGYDRY